MVRLLILALLLSSCSAQWHLKKAIKKDPGIAKTESKTVLQPMFIPQVSGSLDCIMGNRTSDFELPVRIFNPVTGKDTTQMVSVKFKVNPSDSTKVDFTVDCPDPIVSHTESKTTFFVKPTLKEKIILILTGLAIGLLLGFFKNIFKIK